MSRTYPQRVKSSAPLVTANSDAGHSKQVPAEVNRRACTSAAVLGLAISMGASSLLMPQQSDGAIASEPLISEPSLADAPVGSSPVVESVDTQFPTPDEIASATVVPGGQRSANPPSEPLYEAWQVPSLMEAAQEKPQVSAGLPLQASQADAPASSNLALKLQSPPASLAVVENSFDSFKTQPSAEAIPQAMLQSHNLRTPQAPKAVQSPSVGSESKSLTLQERLVTYRVNLGDTLNSIARSHGISVVELATINGISNPNRLQVNQVLKVRASESQEPVQVVPAASAQLEPTVSPSAAPVLSELKPVSEVKIPVSEVKAPASEVKAPIVSSVDERSLNAAALPSAPAEPTLMTELQDVKAQPIQVALNSQTASQAAQSGAKQSNMPSEENLSARVAASQQQASSSPVSSTNSTSELANSTSEVASLTAESVQVPVQPETMPAVSEPASSHQASAAGQASREFSARNQAESLQAEVRSKTEVQPVPVVVNSAGQQIVQVPVSQEPSLYAAAPAGANNYAPISQPLVGQTVSPELPPLGTADKYLPGSQSFNGYMWPARGVLTSGYGWRWGRMHRGIDIAAPIGTPIVAAAPGVVVTAGWNSGGYGNLVEIQHPDGSLTLYAHNNRILVQVGQQVEQGQQIAEMGSTGYSTGPHLHFEVHPRGQGATNPMAFLPNR